MDLDFVERLRFLSDSQLDRLHEASLNILQRVGLNLPHDEALGLFADAGAEVNRDRCLVKIPSALVEQSLQRAGKEFVICGRNPEQKAEFGKGLRHYNSSAGQALWLEGQVGRRRYASLDDVRQAGRLGDALDSLGILGAMADPHELPISYRCVAVAAELIKNTTKPLAFWFYDRASTKYILELSAVVGNGPIAYPLLEPISPLKFPFDGVDLLFEAAKVPLPVAIGPMVQAGMSGPVTLAGTMALQNAEILAGVCLTQLIRPGTPICYGGIAHAFDMSTTQTIFGGPEQALMAVGLTQLGKRYGLAVYVNAGLTDSKNLDAQAGLECAASLLAGALAGAEVFGHMGICGADQGASLDMLIMQHEIIRYVERLCRGFEVADETLGLDVIEAVGPGGTFIDKQHTVKHLRNELWRPQLLDRNFYQAWLETGGKQMDARCAEFRRHLLETYEPEPPAEELVRELDRIVSAAKKFCH